MTRSTLIARAILTFALCLAPALTAQATLFDVEYIDLDGPHWTGQVDTTTDELTILTWSENPGGSDFLFPTGLPITLLAVTSGTGLNPFDVPDDWDGTISTSWAFVLPTPNSSISWGGGTLIPFNDVASFGWGGLFEVGISVTSLTENNLGDMPLDGGFATLSNADSVSVTLVPEPSAGVLLGAGLLATAGARRRSLLLLSRRISQRPRAEREDSP